jgi:ABC-type Mn2+/Zn2+ transport system permease subunit
MMIMIGILATLFIGVLGTAIGYEMNAPSLGPVLAIATMGGFIMAEIRRK